MLKKIIIKELNQILKKNNKFISDIWLYGSIDDEISDLDLILVYKKKPIKINFSSLLKKKVDDGTIIYIPNVYSRDIFLFENLKIFSIKKNKKIYGSIPSKFIPLRNLTSFLERYYERRSLLLKTNKVTPRTLRLIKSIIFSYQNFKQFFKYKNIKFNDKSLNLTEYIDIRKKYLNKRFDKKFFKKFLIKFKILDKTFYNKSLLILDNYYKFSKKFSLNYKFNNYTKYSFTKRKKFIIVPKILGYIYKVYASENNLLSKKINRDFKSDIIKNKKYKILNYYLKKKIIFLNIAFKDLKKQKFKTGLYRLTWYLV